MNKITTMLMLFAAVLFAEDVAVFPPEGVNTDRSYVDAFGMVLSQKYAKVSGLKVLSPLKAAKAMANDSDHIQAAAKLGVSEYLEIETVGLYLSKKEARELLHDSAHGTNVYVNVDNSNSNSSSDDDQEKLDNHKTIVNVSRMDKSGHEIYKVEMTLVTYGDIEEASDRISQALWKKIPIEQTRGMTNITRREGMGNNRMYSEKRKGIKIGGVFPYSWQKDVSVSSMVTIGFDMRFDQEKYFLEVGVGGKIPTTMFDPKSSSYGGAYFDLGGDYYLIPGNVAWYLGGGVIPGIILSISSNSGIAFGLAPYIQTGIMMPRMSKTAFYAEFRVAQHLMPINAGYQTDSLDIYGSPVTVNTVMRPIEFAINFGICW
jgi:hypothetical protein